MTISEHAREWWLAALVVALAATLPYLSTLSGYFLSDDFGLIWLFSQKPPLHFLSLFTSPWTETIYGYRADELRPTLALSYQLDAAWDRASPVAFHLSNILFHAANSLLVLAIGRRVAGLGLIASCIAGVIFAVMPVHVETVAWISGRADSIPTFFYLLAFLAYAMWRRGSSRWVYLASLGSFFLALFSKQTAITFPAVLLMYDGLVQHRLPWHSWRLARAYAPYVLLTGSYLGLRFFLFGNFVREESISAERLTVFWDRQAAYLQMAAFGFQWPAANQIALTLAGLLWLLCLYAAVLGLRPSGRRNGPAGRGLLLFFGPAWWAISVAPLAVTYLSSRHLYLASVGVALAVGLGFQMLRSARRRLWRYAGVLAAGGLILGSTLTLLWAAGKWNASASLSEKMARDVKREASTIPEGSLMVVGASPTGTSRYVSTWVWAFSLPFALQPPFAPARLDERVLVLSRPEVYCCPGTLWFPQAQAAISAWLRKPDPAPVFLLTWDAATGSLARRSDSEDPSLRGSVAALAGAGSSRELQANIESLLRQGR